MPDDPQEFDDNDLSLPQIPDPDPRILPLPPEQQPSDMDMLGDVAAAMEAADAPGPSAAERDWQEIQRVGDQMVKADQPRREHPRQRAARQVAESNQEHAEFLRREAGQPAQPAPQLDSGGGVPDDFGEFLAQVNALRKADQLGPQTPSQIARAYRAYQGMGFDNGLEAPPGQEHLDIAAREGEQGFYRAEQARMGTTGDLFRLLAELAIEETRELTQIKDTLLRNRH